jgi:hypothetical protein
MHLRLCEFINDNNILYKCQFGFREGHNTTLALVKLVDNISSAINNNEFVLGLFLDFKKAFDTINHKILLDKLFKYGIRGIALEWITDYLSNRSQFVCYNNCNSGRKFITCGVPQGSILGPLIFLLYINDLPNCSTVLYSLLFADDTSLFISGKDVNELIQIMNNELIKVTNWLECNKLSLNIQKTKVMIFSSKRRTFTMNSEIIIKGHFIDKVKEIKFLGVLLDNKLSWFSNIQKVKNKVAKSIGLISKARKILSKPTLIVLYNTFIQPYLTYCIELWGSANETYLLPLIKIQKKAIRIISSVPPRTHTEPLFFKCKILNLKKLYQYMTAILMFKHHKRQLPEVCSNLFTSNHEIHSYNTRQRTLLHVPISNSASQMKTIRFMGVQLWNNLSALNIPVNFSIHTFKKHLKKHLLLEYII